MSENSYDLFVSYNQQDRKIVEQLASELVDARLRIWFDKWELVPGSAWHSRFEQAITQSTAIGICIGPEGLGDFDVWALLIKQNPSHLIIPILLPGSDIKDIPTALNEIEFVDFRGGIKNIEEIKKLKVAIIKSKPIDQNIPFVKGAGNIEVQEFSQETLDVYRDYIASFQQAIESNQLDLDAWRNIGIALGNLGKHKEALECFDRLIELNPQDVDAWRNKGIALGNLGKLEEALVCYEKVLTLDSNEAYAWYNKGIALGNLGKNEEALASFEKALELDPEYVQAW
ncbi:MAG TPA: toll/interleukin-1 receptor domain-containing protein, partial [Methanothrix sp.]|nr:toll/interleukin-1 receptor domain-containing protein [Methanothrix sp.]